jgi:pimeloyl-ACP methyl ester carboxylesterase
MLTDPAKYGGDPTDSFDVIVPALISFGTGPAKEKSLKHIAELSWRLMTKELGYPRFAAGGGDGGSPISQLLGVHHPDSIIGLHLTDPGFAMTMGQHENLSEVEQQLADTPLPREWAERRVNLLHFTDFPRGGHFMAWEEPELYTQDLQDFVSQLPKNVT